MIAAAITSQNPGQPVHPHQLNAEESGLSRDSVVLSSRSEPVDKRRLKEKMGRLDEHAMNQVDQALSVSFGLHGEHQRGYRVPPPPDALLFAASVHGKKNKKRKKEKYYQKKGVFSMAALEL